MDTLEMISQVGRNSQIGVASFAISVFHALHETPFDFADIQRSNRSNGAHGN
jgi:hypothetical protein